MVAFKDQYEYFPKPIIMLEAPPAVEQGADENSPTIKNLRNLMRMRLPYSEDWELKGKWFEFRNVYDEPLEKLFPNDGPHIDWRNEEQIKRMHQIAPTLDGRWVVFANRPWQLLKAAYGLHFNDVRFLDVSEVELKRTGQVPIKLLAAWMWHPSDLLDNLRKPDEQQTAEFLFEKIIGRWRDEFANPILNSLRNDPSYLMPNSMRRLFDNEKFETLRARWSQG